MTRSLTRTLSAPAPRSNLDRPAARALVEDLLDKWGVSTRYEGEHPTPEQIIARERAVEEAQQMSRADMVLLALDRYDAKPLYSFDYDALDGKLNH